MTEQKTNNNELNDVLRHEFSRNESSDALRHEFSYNEPLRPEMFDGAVELFYGRMLKGEILYGICEDHECEEPCIL